MLKIILSYNVYSKIQYYLHMSAHNLVYHHNTNTGCAHHNISWTGIATQPPVAPSLVYRTCAWLIYQRKTAEHVVNNK